MKTYGAVDVMNRAKDKRHFLPFDFHRSAHSRLKADLVWREHEFVSLRGGLHSRIHGREVGQMRDTGKIVTLKVLQSL